MKVWVIGDIHGRLDALRALLKRSGTVDGRGLWAGGRALLVQLGDLIDRGPDSRGCVEAVMRLQESSRGRVKVLRGNHEQLLLDAPRSPEDLKNWMGNGAPATLASYGRDFEDLCGGDGEHRRWLESLPLTFELEGALFVHGGIPRDNPKSREPFDLLWSRPPLVRNGHRALVCGHTPTATGKIEVKDGIFFCDTGLAYGRPRGFQLLEMELEADKLEWKILDAD